MSGFKYLRGSEWRKWDLQVHTPFSILNNQFGNPEDENVWNNYVKELFKRAIEKTIITIGVTDYFTIEGYKKIKDEYLNDEINLKELFNDEEVQKIKEILLLPNIEFRLDRFVGRNSINFHVIFSDEVSINDIEENFLHELDFVYAGNPQSQDEKWKLKIENLKGLGDKLKREHPGFRENNLYIGMQNAVVNDSQILDVLSKKPTLFKDKFLIILPADEDLSKIDWNSRDHNVRKVLIQKSDMLFSSNENTKDWALGKKHENIEGFVKEFKGLKPCIWSSDAHSFDKLFEPELKRYTWIKADPTFAGLKQIIYEPEERVYMGEEPPRKLNRGKIIKSLTMSNSNTWFADNKPLLLNEGLISVIGGKGTGKTAVLDLIAYATKSYRIFKEGEKSFLKKAFKELIDTKITVEWVEGVPDEREIGHKLEESPKDGKLRYIPQDFVDQLCSEIGKRELEEQIENVIFQKIPKEDKATYVNFLSYKNDQVKVINDKKQRKAKQIEEINSKIYWLKNSISTKNKKIEEIKKTKDEISKLNNEMKKISESLEDAKNQQKILNEINALNMEKSNFEKEISELNAKLLKIEEIKNRLSMYKEDAEVFVEEIKVDLELIQISQELIEQTKIVFYPENIEEILGTRKSEVEKKRSAKKEKLSKVSDKSRNLNKNLKLEKSKQDSIQKINVILSKETKKLDSLNAEFREIEQAEKNIPDLLSQRDILFIDFFELLFEEKEKLESIYSPLESILKKSAEENERLFDFTVQFDFDIKSMAEKADGFIDHTKEGRFWHKMKAAIYAELERLKFMPNLKNGKISDADKDTARRFLKDVKGLFLKDEEGKELTVVSQLREGYTEKNFDDWLHSTSYYSITYSIKFNDIELDNLSPGLKGVALLILYLELDKEDTRPILIDQPEENLDNRSVYKTLMRYFREAKKRRQIIIVTHNPNLVVNTDSEQIIVANFDKGLEKQCARINYVSGSLENTFKLSKDDYPEEDWNKIPDLQKEGIREHVCEILEGGREAFEKREKKYGFKTS